MQEDRPDEVPSEDQAQIGPEGADQTPPTEALLEPGEPESSGSEDSAGESDESTQPSGEVDSTQEMYTFDPEKFDAETEEEISSYIKWAEGSAHWSEPERLRSDIRDRRRDRAQERVWSELYSGRVPKHWGEVNAGSPWHAIKRDIEDPNVQLTDDMVEAAIDYPLWHIPRELGERRPLTPEQLHRLERTGTLPARTMDGVRRKQHSIPHPESGAA